ALHPTEAIPDDAPSRFKKEGADAPKANGHDAVAAAAAAPAPAPAAKPVAAPAAKPAAAAAPQRVVGMRGRVEKAVPRPAAVARPVPSFAGELPIDFEKLLAELGPSRRRTSSRLGSVGFALLAVGQGILGALPAGSKQRIAATVNDRRFFDPALATAGNVFLNLLLYPIVSLGFAVATRRVDLFTLAVHPWIFLGLRARAGARDARLRVPAQPAGQHVRRARPGDGCAGTEADGGRAGLPVGVHDPRVATRSGIGLPSPVPGQDARGHPPQGGRLE